MDIGIERTGAWLANNNNSEVANQMAAAGLALYNIGWLTGQEKYRLAAAEKVHHLIMTQDSAGYFPEYGGYDIGYLSLTLSLLGKYYRKTQDESLSKPMMSALRFLEDRIDADGSYDNRGTSRRTRFLYPHGFMILRSDVSNRHVRGLASNKIISPAWLDDRYVIPLTIDYLQTYLESADVDDHQ